MLANTAAYYPRSTAVAPSGEQIYYSSSSPPSSSSSSLLYSSPCSTSPMNPYYQFEHMQRQDAQAIMLHNPPKYPYQHYPNEPLLRPSPNRAAAAQYNLESAEEIQRRAEFVQRREWMKRVAEWIAQTETMANYKPQRLDAIPEMMEETLASEVVLYVASPPSTTIPLYPPYGSACTPSLSSSSSSAPSSPSSPLGGSAKSVKKTSHRRTSSLESISEEAEE